MSWDLRPSCSHRISTGSREAGTPGQGAPSTKPSPAPEAEAPGPIMLRFQRSYRGLRSRLPVLRSPLRATLALYAFDARHLF